jgi:hypothetical protein
VSLPQVDAVVGPDSRRRKGAAPQWKPGAAEAKRTAVIDHRCVGGSGGSATPVLAATAARFRLGLVPGVVGEAAALPLKRRGRCLWRWRRQLGASPRELRNGYLPVRPEIV